jgi:prepilin-type N-terminal cleavage/methylation domain-containing protein
MKLPALLPSPTSSNRGFTLIELLVAITVMTILMGAGIAGFINFNDRQKVLTTARELQTFMRSAQRKAQVRETPAACVTGGHPFRGYQVWSDATTIRMRARCGSIGSPSWYGATRTMAIPSGVTVENTSSNIVNMRFLELYGGVRFISAPLGVDAQTIRVIGSSNTYRFQVSKSGEISEGCWEGSSGCD